MATKVHVKKGDNVLILAGKDKGQTGRITAVNRDNGRVIVDGCNTLTRHHKGRSAQDTSRIEKISGSIDASNVQILCPSCSKATRVSIVFGAVPEGGSKPLKVRTCKKCGASLDAKAKADKAVKDSKKSVKKTAKKEDAPVETTEKKPVKKTPAKKEKDVTAAETPEAKKPAAKKPAAKKPTDEKKA